MMCCGSFWPTFYDSAVQGLDWCAKVTVSASHQSQEHHRAKVIVNTSNSVQNPPRGVVPRPSNTWTTVSSTSWTVCQPVSHVFKQNISILCKWYCDHTSEFLFET